MHRTEKLLFADTLADRRFESHLARFDSLPRVARPTSAIAALEVTIASPAMLTTFPSHSLLGHGVALGPRARTKA